MAVLSDLVQRNALFKWLFKSFLESANSIGGDGGALFVMFGCLSLVVGFGGVLAIPYGVNKLGVTIMYIIASLLLVFGFSVMFLADRD
jgi:hypothetical protein